MAKDEFSIEGLAGRKDFCLKDIVRPNIWALKPYRCARDDYSEGVLLDANENSHGPALPRSAMQAFPGANHILLESQLERYPDPHQRPVKELLAKFRHLPSPDHFFLGVGSDESLDLIMRVFCAPGKDKILVCPPTYGMYSVCAQINDLEVVKVNQERNGQHLTVQFTEVMKVAEADPSIKVIFLCSPGNPTAEYLPTDQIKQLLEYGGYKGIVVVDEAYIDFADDGSSIAHWTQVYPNLIVTQTLSKSFGLAGIRLGVAISSPEIAQILNNTKAPYNISTITSAIAGAALSDEGIAQMRSLRSDILIQRNRLEQELGFFKGLGSLVGGRSANFLLVPVLDSSGKPNNELAHQLYKKLAEVEGVVVRYRGLELGCEGCLRITVGTEKDMDRLLECLKKYLDYAPRSG
ncbi:pyridoxal phosphate-dependent transferase [Phlyctochytrium arcticum]|nr:pyridoxal phosphate-dependent transferase [Phlyctochytrium arcticum]